MENVVVVPESIQSRCNEFVSLFTFETHVSLNDFLGGLVSLRLGHEEFSILSSISIALDCPLVDQRFQEKVIRVLVWHFAIIIQMVYGVVSRETISDLV